MRPGCAGLIKFKKVHNVDSQKRDEWGTLIADSSDYDGTALYKRKTKKVKTIRFSEQGRRRVKAIVTADYTDVTTATTVTPADTTTTTNPTTLSVTPYEEDGDPTTTPAPEPETDTPDEEVHVVLLMDETGSMQPNRQKLIDAYNEHIIQNKNKWTNNGKKTVTYTYASFNTEMKIHEWGPITNAKKLTREGYNPGYNTRLYDAVGCIADKYGHENDVIFNVWSDGRNHQREAQIYNVADVADVISSRRGNNWKMYFMGCGKDQAAAAGIKDAANKMGFYSNEVTLFDGAGESDVNDSLKELKSSLDSEIFADDMFSFRSRGSSRKNKGRRGNGRGKGKGHGKGRRNKKGGRFGKRKRLG